MYKRLLFLVVMIGLLSSPSVFALKGPRSTASKSKVSEVSNTEVNNTVTATKENDASSQKTIEKKIIFKPKRPKPITKIFLPGHDKKSKNIICQGIAYIPDILMANGEPRYALLSYCPNRAVSKAPSQIVVIDREIKERNKAIRRFSLYKTLGITRDLIDFEQALEKNEPYEYGEKEYIHCDNTVDDDNEVSSISWKIQSKNQTSSVATTKDDSDENEEIDDEDDIDNEDDENLGNDATEMATSIASKEISNEVSSISWNIENDDDDEKDNSVIAVSEIDDEEDEESISDKLMICGGSDPYRGHAGGIAVAGNYVWVSSNFKLHGFSLKKIKRFIRYSYARKVREEGLPYSLRIVPAMNIVSSKTIDVDAKASFLSFDGHYMWVGDYVRNSKNAEGKNCPPVEHHKLYKHLAWIAGYRYDLDKDDIISDTIYPIKYNGKTHKVRKPDVVFSIRQNAQGFAVCGRYIALAVSQGTKKSKILVFENPMMRKIYPVIRPVKERYICNGIVGTFTEDLATYTDNISTYAYDIATYTDIIATYTEAKKLTTTDVVLDYKTYKVDGKSYPIRAYNLSNKNKVTVITKPIPAQIQDLEYDGHKLYATFACNSGTFKAKHKGEKIILTKYFYLIDLKRYLPTFFIQPIRPPFRPVGPIDEPNDSIKPIKPYMPIRKLDNATYTIQERYETNNIEEEKYNDYDDDED